MFLFSIFCFQFSDFNFLVLIFNFLFFIYVSMHQLLGTCAKNLLVFNVGEFAAFPSIVIPSLIGISNHLNPDESLHMTASQTSWLCKFKSFISIDHKWINNLCDYFAASFAYLAHPIGGLLSGPLNDKFGRRKTIMVVCIPIAFAWLLMGFSYSFPVICFGFTFIGFCFGLKEAAAATFVSEIRWVEFKLVEIKIYTCNYAFETKY